MATVKEASGAEIAEARKVLAEQLPAGNAANIRILKTLVIEPSRKLEDIQKAKGDNNVAASKELAPDDLLNSLSSDGRVLIPPFDKLVLAMLPENSSSLGPVIEAMVQNCDGFGHHLESRIHLDNPDVPEAIKQKVLDERAKLINFFNNCCVDPPSFIEMRRRVRTDVETTGEGFIEVIRAPTTNEIVQLAHIPSYQISLGAQDYDLTLYDRRVPSMQPDGSVKLETVKTRKRFRRFIQSRISSVFSRGATFHRGSQIRWFKEFADPRVINNKNGEVVTDPEAIKGMVDADKAGELLHIKIYSPRTPYGLPRYIGNLITLFGDRNADEINYITLRNNNVPSMMLMVSNGQLTDASIDRIQEFVDQQIAGQNNYSKILLIEAEGHFEGQESGVPKIQVEKLASEQKTDQLFQNYSKNNRDKVRECWRIPPIFMGRSEEYTRATAEVSRRIADEQVFSPEREEFDTRMNHLILPELGVLYHKFISNGPNVTDDQDLIAVMGVAERSGGMTPRMARGMLADILGMDEHNLPPLDPSVEPDVPFMLQVAEKVKNTANPDHQLAVKSVLKSVMEAETMTLDHMAPIVKLRDELEHQLMRSRRRAAEPG